MMPDFEIAFIVGPGTWQVYDVTEYLDDHPGGDDVLLSATGIVSFLLYNAYSI